jgi:outer membrane protein TolC
MILMATSLFGQGQLDEYLRIAAEQNPSLRAKYNMYLASLERVNQQDVLPDPTVSFGYFISPVETRVGQQRMKFSISQMFPWMGTLKTKEQAAASVAKVRFEEFQGAKNELFLKVKTKWLALYELDKEIEIMEANLSIFRSYEPITKTKYESNLVSLADLIRVQIQIDDASTKVDLLKLKKKPLLSDFNTLLNRDLDIEIDLDLAADLMVDNYQLDSALVNQPEIRALNAKLIALDYELELVELNRKPNIGVGLDYGVVSKREDIAVPDNGKDILMPMISLSLPIFGKKNKSLKKEVGLKQESVKEALIAAQNDIRNSWTQTDYEIESANTVLGLYQKEIEKTELLLKVLTTAYSNNNSDFEALLTTQQRLLQLELAVVKANIKQQEALFQKDYLTTSTLNQF